MATAYHRDQPGAPDITFSNTVSGRFDAFKAVLKACLVTGYGAYPAAGWGLVAEADSYLVLRPGTLSGYVCLARSGSVIRISVSATFAGVSGGIIQGDGAKSGIASDNTLPQVVYLYAFAQSAASTWHMVADERTFIINAVSNTASPIGASPESFPSNVEYSSLIYAGEDSQGNFISVGGASSLSTSATAPSAYFSSDGMTSLKNPATGLLLSSSPLGAIVPISRRQAATPVFIPPPSPVFPEINLAKVSWLVPGYYCGTFRGIAACPELSGISFKSSLECIGFAGANTRNLNTPINFGDSNSWFALAIDQRYAPLMLMTDAPGYW